jgi:phosphatidylserine/phosphatidylglycerophosphate/cardiolipin synthase-like enzyme
VDTSKATVSSAQDIGHNMADTLAAYIDRANISIDFCIYNINSSTIATALNNAYDRGVMIRFITCGSTAHSSTSSLNSNIYVVERPDEDDGIMHNKFAVFDANSSDPDDAWVWSGSTNLTYSQLNSDINNMIFVQDQSLAKVYKIEFEEMWGSSDAQPEPATYLFGADKTDNTPHDIYLQDGTHIESYFSPSDNTNQKIINAIETADNDLEVETMLITRSDLAQAILDAYDRGVDVSVVTDNESDNSTTVTSMLSSALSSDKYIYDNDDDVLLHNKVAIIDVDETSSDPQLITGSHNWSSAADSYNDENTLIIHSADLSNQYLQQFASYFTEKGGDLTVSAQQIAAVDVKVYPNPTQENINISSPTELTQVDLYSVTGQLVMREFPETNSVSFSIGEQEKGMYILRVADANGNVNTYKVIKQ